ncbi:hypothetical protein KCU98_g1674, partial [Aureobasidium melanogenum]
MSSPTIYSRYKRTEKIVFRYINRVPPKSYQELLDTCTKIETKVFAIKEAPPQFVIVNLGVVIQLRELCAADFEEELETKDTATIDSVKRHRYWINFLKKLLDKFLDLQRRYRGTTGKAGKKITAKNKKKSNDKPSAGPNTPKPLQNSFEGLDVEEILDEAIDDDLAETSNSTPTTPSSRPSTDPPMPEEADDRLFLAWCHLKYLACGRDKLFGILDEVRQGRLSIEAGSTICRHTFDHMHKVSTDFSLKNLDLGVHRLLLEYINVPVLGVSDPDTLRELTKRERLLVAEEGSVIMSILCMAKDNMSAVQEAMANPFCRDILQNFDIFLDIERLSIFGTEAIFFEMSYLVKNGRGQFFSHIPFMIEVLVAVRKYFVEQTPEMYLELEQQSKCYEGESLFHTVAAVLEGRSPNPTGDGVKYTALIEHPPKVVNFSKSMVLTVAETTRRIKLNRYLHALDGCSRYGMMLAVCHFYCALKSHNLIKEDEIWEDMDFFLVNHVPLKEKNHEGFGYKLDYAKNLRPAAILTSFLLGMGIPNSLLTTMDRMELVAGVSKYRQDVRITPTSRAYIQFRKQQKIDKEAGRQIDRPWIRGYHGLFSTETPSVKALTEKLREDEEQLDKLVNFDLNYMLAVVMSSFLNEDKESSNTGAKVVDNVAALLNLFAVSKDKSVLRNAWERFLPQVKSLGDGGCRGLEKWETSIKTFGEQSRNNEADGLDDTILKLEADIERLRMSPPSQERDQTMQEMQSFATAFRLHNQAIKDIAKNSTHESRGELLDEEDY